MLFLCCVDRSTAIGRQINAYLSNEIELEDHSVHLLFAANRWEMVYVTLLCVWGGLMIAFIVGLR